MSTEGMLQSEDRPLPMRLIMAFTMYRRKLLGASWRRASSPRALAQVDTEGVVAKDTFYVTYHGEPLGPSMTQLVTNALQYYLSLADVEKEESY